MKSTKMAIVAMALLLTAGACSQQDNKNSKNNKAADKTAAAPIDPNGKIVIRYVDEDSIANNYNLAKDFQEMATRLQNEMDAAQKKYSDQINSFQNSMQQKYNNNQYTSEAAMQADGQKLQQMQQNAQTELAKLQQNAESQMLQSQKQINDSIDNFLKDYAAKNHYDMILKKAAAFYLNPNLEVTDEVIEGLNKRYTKVAKK